MVGYGPVATVTPLSHLRTRLWASGHPGLTVGAVRSRPPLVSSPRNTPMKQLAVLAIGALSAALAHANNPVLIDFETPTSFASVLSHYDGGTDSDGAAGADLGVARSTCRIRGC
jgi:hypothetical protein